MTVVIRNGRKKIHFSHGMKKMGNKLKDTNEIWFAYCTNKHSLPQDIYLLTLIIIIWLDKIKCWLFQLISDKKSMYVKNTILHFHTPCCSVRMEGNIVDIQMDRPLHSYTLLLSANCWLKANKQGKAKRIKQKKLHTSDIDITYWWSFNKLSMKIGPYYTTIAITSQTIIHKLLASPQNNFIMNFLCPGGAWQPELEYLNQSIVSSQYHQTTAEYSILVAKPNEVEQLSTY